MKPLTEKEADIMDKLWKKDDEMISHEIMDMFPEPRPKLFTVSAFLRILVDKGWVKSRPIGNTYLYKATISQEEAGKRALNLIQSKFFKGSRINMVNTLLKDESISDGELEELLQKMEQMVSEKNKKLDVKTL